MSRAASAAHLHTGGAPGGELPNCTKSLRSAAYNDTIANRHGRRCQAPLVLLHAAQWGEHRLRPQNQVCTLIPRSPVERLLPHPALSNIQKMKPPPEGLPVLCRCHGIKHTPSTPGTYAAAVMRVRASGPGLASVATREMAHGSEALHACYWLPCENACFLTVSSLLKTLPRKAGSGNSLFP